MFDSHPFSNYRIQFVWLFYCAQMAAMFNNLECTTGIIAAISVCSSGVQVLSSRPVIINVGHLIKGRSAVLSGLPNWLLPG
jgi:hypothetical protein